MLAHELRNPLAPIRTAVQLLRLKELPAAQTAMARDIIDRQVEHLVRLIDDLLDVSRITRGIISLRRETVLVGAIIARAVETARPLIDARRHSLSIELPDDLLTVDGDKTRLVQVIGNVLHNAAKFTPPGGTIALNVTREGPHAVIRVKDSGIGISPDIAPTIFDLFAQADSKGESPEGGLGIGLALVRRLVEMHDGTVAASSPGPGLGTTVTVRLPLLAAQTWIGDQSERKVPMLEPRRILLADDNADALEALALQLRFAGHDVRTARDGAEAVRVGSEFEPQVVLLDLGMPGMNGYDAAREIRRHPWGTQVLLIALTGWGQQQDRQRTSETGFDAHLVKPVTQIDLFQAIAARAV
nr:hypothetical protein [uncultured bacterium]